MLLVIVLSVVVYKGCAGADTPSREFTGAELAGPGPDHEGTCYGLSTVLVANGLYGSVPRTWAAPRDGAWTLGLERMSQAAGGPVREFQNFTFEQHGDTVRLVAVEASPGFPQDVPAAIDELLRVPNVRGSTPVDRCLAAGASGYRFVKKS
jgi:hypothetical protein